LLKNQIETQKQNIEEKGNALDSSEKESQVNMLVRISNITDR
jgi:hypothetical protein